eukprot:scaffold910_cov396-Prasinococcus_capsulatus_cf.AAC.72
MPLRLVEPLRASDVVVPQSCGLQLTWSGAALVKVWLLCHASEGKSVSSLVGCAGVLVAHPRPHTDGLTRLNSQRRHLRRHDLRVLGSQPAVLSAPAAADVVAQVEAAHLQETKQNRKAHPAQFSGKRAK